MLLLIFAGLFLTACGARLSNQNWPGLSTDGENLYLANGTQVLAYEAATQSLNWAYPQETGALQFYAAPSVEGERVVFGDYGAAGGFFSPSVTVSVYARENVDTGGEPPELWTTSEVADDKIVAPPLQVGDRLYVGTADNFVVAMDATDGREIWSYETGHSIWGQPVMANDILLVSSMDRSVYAFEPSDGTVLWRVELTGALASQPVVNEDLLYVGSFDSQVHALEIETGDEAWSATAENWVWGAPTYADGSVYFADIDGNVYAVDAKTGESRWQSQALGAVQTSPLVVDDRVFVASEGASSDVAAGALTAFSAEDGSEIWQKLTPAPLFTTPIAIDDLVVVALQSEESIMMAFLQETGGQQWTISPPVPAN